MKHLILKMEYDRAEASMDVRDAIALLNGPRIRDNQHQLGLRGSGDIEAIKSLLQSAQEKLTGENLRS